MDDNKLKEAFTRVREDVFNLGNEFSQMRFELEELKSELKLVFSVINDIKLKEFTNSVVPTHQQRNPTNTPIPTDNPTVPCEIKGSLSPIRHVSIGNAGVPTDRPTDKQTDQHITILDEKRENTLDKASEILASLDNLKKEIRFKFKRLTSQEMQVFSTIYTMEERNELIDYRILATTLNLSESSVRDYIGKIQKKGILITKEKLNNKRVILHISQDLKKIASLNTIVKLREL